MHNMHVIHRRPQWLPLLSTTKGLQWAMGNFQYKYDIINKVSMTCVVADDTFHLEHDVYSIIYQLLSARSSKLVRLLTRSLTLYHFVPFWILFIECTVWFHVFKIQHLHSSPAEQIFPSTLHTVACVMKETPIKNGRHLADLKGAENHYFFIISAAN